MGMKPSGLSQPRVTTDQGNQGKIIEIRETFQLFFVLKRQNQGI